LDGQSFEEASKENNLKTITIKSIDSNKKDKNDKIIKNLSDSLFKKIYVIKNEKSPEVLKIDDKYFLAEIKSIERSNKPINDPDVLKAINAQLNFQNKIENNTSIIKDISMGGFDKTKMKKFANDNNLETITIKSIDGSKKNKNDKKIKNLSDNLFKKIYVIKNEKSPEVLKVNNKYYLAVIKSIEKNNRPINDPDVVRAINAQLNFKNKIESNASIIKDISMGGFDKVKMEKFANDNNLEIKDYKVSGLKQNEIFTEGIIKRIFLTKDGEIDLITNSTLTKNFLVLSMKTQYKKIKKNSNEYEQYEAKARLNLINKIYRAFDNNLNQKYKVELNKRTIDRVKNSF